MSHAETDSRDSAPARSRTLSRYAIRIRRGEGGLGGGLWMATGILILIAIASHALWELPAVALQHTEATAERALETFAVARGINAVISVIQDVEIGFAVGFAATLSPGEILDPVNDLIERFSLVMLVSSALFWTLRLVSGLLFEQGLLWSVAFLYLGSSVLLAARKPWMNAAGDLGVRLSTVFLVMLGYAFITPLVISIVHDTEFITAEYRAATTEINAARETLEAMNLELSANVDTDGKDDGCDGLADCIGSFGETVSSLSRKIGIGDRYQGYIDEATELADRISRQVVVQIAVFVLETLVIPIFGLWVAGLAIRRLIQI